eukprot:2528501-Prymnesium_polylepis.2
MCDDPCVTAHHLNPQRLKPPVCDDPCVTAHPLNPQRLKPPVCDDPSRGYSPPHRRARQGSKLAGCDDGRTSPCARGVGGQGTGWTPLAWGGLASKGCALWTTRGVALFGRLVGGAVHLAQSVTCRTPCALARISRASRVHLACISRASRVHRVYISHASRAYLARISCAPRTGALRADLAGGQQGEEPAAASGAA